MEKKFIERWELNKQKIKEGFSVHPKNYQAIVKLVIENLGNDDYDDPDPDRIHLIDDGDYQGTLLFVIASKGYQPNTYYYVKVGYGSCSGCDTLQRIRDYDENPPTDDQVSQYMTLALHIVQGLKQI